MWPLARIASIMVFTASSQAIFSRASAITRSTGSVPD